MQRSLCVFAIVFALATCLYAQPDPNGPAPNPQQPNQGQGRFNNPMGGGMMANGQNNLAMEILPRGVFLLHNGVLAKFDVVTLKPGGTLELFGPLPPRPQIPQNPTDQDRQAMRQWFMLAQPRSAPTATLAKDDMLYIIIGATFFRVNTATMTMDAKSDLAANPNAGAAPVPGGNPPAAPAGGGNNGRLNQMMMNGPAQMKLNNGILYVILQQELLAVDPKTGNVTTRVPLPAEMLPTFGGNGGFRGNGGQGGNPRNGGQGGNNRGNRGNRGGNQNPPAAGDAPAAGAPA